MDWTGVITEEGLEQFVNLFHQYAKTSSNPIEADRLDKLKKALSEPSNFAEFYPYAFTYFLTDEKQESINIETICQLLDIIMASTFRPQVDYFVDYLKIQNDYKVINMDQWMGFYRFCNEVIGFPEMTEYNQELAWPLLLNNFVEWIREKTSLKA
ncbi:Potentiating neddylation domain-containing protein [Hirschfeldia incana]|nr:Potentiating neddylation domain-containing protein [Hirschfeldia incana]